MRGWRLTYVAGQLELCAAEYDCRRRPYEGRRDRFSGLFCRWKNSLDKRRGRHSKAYVSELKSQNFRDECFHFGIAVAYFSSCFHSLGFTVVQEAGVRED